MIVRFLNPQKLACTQVVAMMCVQWVEIQGDYRSVF